MKSSCFFSDFWNILKDFLDKIKKTYEIIVRKNWHVFGVIQEKNQKIIGKYFGYFLTIVYYIGEMVFCQYLENGKR